MTFPRLQLEETILATRDWMISQDGINVPFELKRRDPKEPGRRRKEKAEDKTYKVTMRHFRKQKKALRDNLEWHYPHRTKVIGTTDYTDLLSDDDYDAQLQAMLTQAAQDGVLLFEETGVGMPSIDYTLVNTQAAKWASKYSGSLIKGIDATTLASVRGAVSSFVDTPGMTIGDVMRGLGPTFSEDRALMIATTEITKAYAEADKLSGDQMAKEFPDMEVVKTWWTNNDDLVCQICGPNHNVTVLKGENFPSGNDSPPAHPRCRCWRSTTTRFREEELIYDDVTTPKQAEKWITDNLGIEVDYTGIDDVRLLNIANKELTSLYNKMGGFEVDVFGDKIKIIESIRTKALGNAIAEYRPLTRELILDVKRWGDREEYLKFADFTKTGYFNNHPASIIDHEVGHAVMNLDGELYKSASSIFEGLSEKELNSISYYANFNKHEMVSEAFTHYVSNGYLPQSSGVINDVLSPIFERILSPGGIIK